MTILLWTLRTFTAKNKRRFHNMITFMVLFFAFNKTSKAIANEFSWVLPKYIFMDERIISPKEIPSDAKWQDLDPEKTALSPQAGKALWLYMHIESQSPYADSALRFERINARFDYFHGESKVYSYGKSDGYPGLPVQILDLPIESKEKDIYLRIESTLPRIGPMGRILVGSRSEFIKQLVTNDVPGAFVVSVLLLLGLAGLVLFCFYSNVRTYFNLAIFSLVSSFYFFGRLRSRTIFGVDPVDSGIIGLLGLYSSPLFFLAFFREIFSIQHLKIFKNLQIVSAFFVVIAAIGSIWTAMGPLTFLLPFYLVVIPVFAVVIYHSAVKMRNHQYSRTFFFGVACLFVSGSWEVAREMKIAHFSVQMLVWGFLGFVLSLVTMQGRFFATLFQTAKENAIAANESRERLERVLVCTHELAQTRNYRSLIRVVAEALIIELKMTQQKVSIDFFVSRGEGVDSVDDIHQFRFMISKDNPGGELFEVLASPNAEQSASEEKGIEILNSHSSLDSNTGNPKQSEQSDLSSVLTIPLLSLDFVGAVTIRKHDGKPFDLTDYAQLTKFVAALSDSLLIALQNLEYFSEVKKKAIIEHELDAAFTIQSALLPDPLNLPEVEYRSFCKSAGKTGGDWHGYYHCTKHNRLFITVGDVTGHDFAASIMTGVAAGAVKAWQKDLAGTFKSAKDALENLASLVNRVLCSSNKGLKFMTMSFLCVELDNGTVHILNAGHPHPFLFSTLKPMSVIVSAGNLLGEDEFGNFTARSLQLNMGDTLVIYTDGLFENHGPEHRTLHRKNFSKQIEPNAGAGLILDSIITQAQTIWLDVPPDDDVTLVALTWKTHSEVNPQVA